MRKKKGCGAVIIGFFLLCGLAALCSPSKQDNQPANSRVQLALNQ